ncbi:MAG TPA: hypothetical protein VKY57_01945 [Chitinispirillaceae bacterium]|nr:hypothetical protein [Chitinispirillaceae bacterium]
MPEGPSLVIVKEQMFSFVGKKVVVVEGNSKTDIERMKHELLKDVKTWGKHLLLCFPGFTFRIHFLLFGTYLINENKKTPLRLGLCFENGVINFYSTSIKILEGDINKHYDWSADVMNEEWNGEAALQKLYKNQQALICDALLEQDIFSGVGNIIKNEVLYRVKIHPEAMIGKIPQKKLQEIVEQARIYSFEFLEWKKAYVLKKHWLAYTKKICHRCNLPFSKKNTGKKKRRSFFCPSCQKLFV